jgi:membrane fusion protein, multidrug efflux system
VPRLATRVRSVIMKAAGHSKFRWIGGLISLVIIVFATAIAFNTLHESYVFPTTSDSSIDADVVHVAAAVGGKVLEIPVSENDSVARGDLLFQIDPVPYQQAVAQAEADLHIAEAELETRRRTLSTQRSTALIAGDETKNALENHQLAKRTADRLRPLAASGYVPKQQLDQAEVAERDTATALAQAQERHAAAVTAIDTEAAAEAAVRARRAALAIAQRALENTTVRAPHDGLVVGLTISSGETIAPAQTLFTLINTEEWYAVANFRETELDAIAIGDCATVYSMLDRKVPIRGTVQGIGWGVLDQDRISLLGRVPYVERSLNWVRVAQRFPVRIRLENPPPHLMRLGASAVVEMKHGAQCR